MDAFAAPTRSHIAARDGGDWSRRCGEGSKTGKAKGRRGVGERLAGRKRRVRGPVLKKEEGWLLSE